jgi:hypothetical protein
VVLEPLINLLIAKLWNDKRFMARWAQTGMIRGQDDLLLDIMWMSYAVSVAPAVRLLAQTVSLRYRRTI